MIELTAEETKKAQNEYLDSLKSKCKFQLLFGSNPFETYVVLNDQIVGFVQEVNVHVEADKQVQRKVEIAFPKIDDPTWASAKEFAQFVQALEALGFVTVKYKELKWETPNPSEEVEKVFAESSDADFERSLAMVRGQSEQRS